MISNLTLTLKAAMLAHYGHNLQTRAQQFHAWSYDATSPVRPQVASLMRLTRSWLTTGDGPPALDKVVMDRSVRALQGDAKLHASQSSPKTVDDLEEVLENHQVTVEFMRSSRPAPARSSRPEPLRPHRPDPRRERPGLRKEALENYVLELPGNGCSDAKS